MPKAEANKIEISANQRVMQKARIELDSKKEAKTVVEEATLGVGFLLP